MSSFESVALEDDGVGRSGALCDGAPIAVLSDQADARSGVIIHDGGGNDVVCTQFDGIIDLIDRDDESLIAFDQEVLDGIDGEGDDLTTGIQWATAGVGDRQCDLFGSEISGNRR